MLSKLNHIAKLKIVSSLEPCFKTKLIKWPSFPMPIIQVMKEFEETGCRFRSPSATPTLKKLVAQVLIYHVWRQRNSVLHNNTHLLQAETFRLIDRDVRNTITARRKRRKFTNIMALWIRWPGHPITKNLLPFLFFI